jgi:hypothetical protein
MITMLKETAGDTLTGAVDGANTVFVVSYDFQTGTPVNVYLNGRLKVASWDDGYTTTEPRTVTMKEAPLVGDTLEVEYQTSFIKTGGGAEGGIPCPPRTDPHKPSLTVEELVPCLSRVRESS